MSIKKDISGQKFGELKAIEIDKNWNKNRRTHWICECSCGKIVSKSISILTKKISHSCGDKIHHIKVDLSGRIFGDLTVIKISNKISWDGRRFWVCECKCGKSKDILEKSLKNGDSKSCGCKRNKSKNESHVWKGYGEISGRYYTRIKNGAIDRNLEFDIDIVYIWDLFLKQNRKCILSGIDIKFGNEYLKIETTASLDRIDSKKGYTKENVQWVHKKVNFMKGVLQLDEFINICKNISKICR